MSTIATNIKPKTELQKPKTKSQKPTTKTYRLKTRSQKPTAKVQRAKPKTKGQAPKKNSSAQYKIFTYPKHQDNFVAYLHLSQCRLQYQLGLFSFHRLFQ